MGGTKLAQTISGMSPYDLVFFSTFEELTLPIKGPMEDAGVVKLYEPFPTPCLYVALAANMVGKIPIMPCFLDGSVTPVAATSMRSTCGCGCLDVASLAWAA